MFCYRLLLVLYRGFGLQNSGIFIIMFFWVFSLGSDSALYPSYDVLYSYNDKSQRLSHRDEFAIRPVRHFSAVNAPAPSTPFLIPFWQ